MNKFAACPTCKKDAELSAANLYRPFCSKRCRLIDLGQWVNESYSISEKTTVDDSFIPDSTQKH
jgi:uncharacterized protein